VAVPVAPGQGLVPELPAATGLGTTPAR